MGVGLVLILARWSLQPYKSSLPSSISVMPLPA